MPKQISGVTIQDTGNGQCAITILGQTDDGPSAALFDLSVTADHVLDNMRLNFLIGGYGNVASQEFKSSVNKGQSGMETPGGKLFLISVDPEPDNPGRYTVTLGRRMNQVGLTLNGVSDSDLATDYGDRETIKRNLRTFLRLGGHTSLTAAAIADVAKAKFWL